MSEDYPDLEEAAYELRFTGRALEDLNCPNDTPPGDAAAVRAGTEYTEIVAHFQDQRTAHPTSGGPPLRDVGRHDIYSVRGPVGERACTWYDRSSGICWFLGRVAGHDYDEFEVRAANGELLPSEDDYTSLEFEREELDLASTVGPGVRRLVDQAVDRPGVPVRRTVGHLLQLDVSVLALDADDDTYRELYITVRVPPLEPPPQDWPGGDGIAERVAELATNLPAEELSLEFPTEVPAGTREVRQIDFSAERAVVIRGWTLPD